MIFLYILILIAVLITPIPKIGRFRWLKQHHAHRGLFDDNNPENSYVAFENAIKHGLAIECDVRLSSDDVPIMIHDPTLKRLCLRDDAVNQLTYDELKKMSIAQTNQTLISLETVLNLVDGQVPIMIEIKPNDSMQKSVDRVFEVLNGYHGNVSIVSFDPRIVRMSKKKGLKHIPIGQIIEIHFKNKSLVWWQRVLLTLNAYQRFSRADFISIHIKLWPYYQWMTWIGVRVGIWPIKNQSQLKRCNDNNIVILEKEAL